MEEKKSNLERLTDRQKVILDIITNHIVQEGIPPTLREIGRAAGIASLNGVVDHLKALYRKGWLRHTGKAQARGYTLSAAASEILPVAHQIVPEALVLKKLNNFIKLKKLDEFIRDFPDNILADLKKCTTPQAGALHIVNVVDKILSGDY
jgi:SOS-response transcriptional repressor LexA